MQHDFVACVVGLSNNPAESFGTRPGAGKSCLCFRFTYPGYDRYIDTHPSVFALHEFASPVINNTHFLYWGSPMKSYPVKGGDIRVRFHLLEHTVFYQDITCHPFNALTRPDDVNYYIKRIIGSIESSGKHSYHSRDEMASSTAYKKLQYPSNLSKQMRGYIVAFDVSLAETELEMQVKRVVPILEFFTRTKRKFVFAATKRDTYKIMSLERLRELHRKYRAPLVETSANENLNVDEVFRVLAKQVLGKRAQGMTDHVQNYDEAARYNLHCRGAAKRAFLAFMKKDFVNCDERLDPIQATDQYKACAQWIGEYHTGNLFLHHQLGLYNVKVDTYAGVMEDPTLRREFLEGFVDSRSDMRKYSKELRRWIDNYIEQIEEMTPPKTELGSKSDTTLDSLDLDGPVEPYQVFHKGERRLEGEEGPSDPDGLDPLAASNSSGSLDDHDYMNYDPKTPLLQPVGGQLLLQTLEQANTQVVATATPTPASDTSTPALDTPTSALDTPTPAAEQTADAHTSTPAAQEPLPSTPTNTQAPSPATQQTSLPPSLPPDPVSSLPPLPPPPLLPPAPSLPPLPPAPLLPPAPSLPPLPPDSDPLIQAPVRPDTPPPTQTTAFADSTGQDPERLQNQPLDHSPPADSLLPQGPPGNGTSITWNGTDNTENGMKRTENENGNESVVTESPAGSVELKKAASPPPVLPKPGKQKPALSQSAMHPPPPPVQSQTQAASPGTPRGKAPPPPVRSSSVIKTATSDESPVVSPATQHKVRGRMASSESEEGKTSEPPSPTAKSIGRRPSRVAPPPPAMMKTQSPVFSPTRKTESPILVAKTAVGEGSTSSSGTVSPILSPSHPLSSPLFPRSPATVGGGGEGVDKTDRPMLNKIRQKIAEKKDVEEKKDVLAEVEEESKEECAAGSRGSRLAEIRKRLATQKKSSDASALPPRAPPSDTVPPPLAPREVPNTPAPPTSEKPSLRILAPRELPSAANPPTSEKPPRRQRSLAPSPPSLPPSATPPLTSTPPDFTPPAAYLPALPSKLKQDDDDIFEAPPVPVRTPAMLETGPKPKPKPRSKKPDYTNVVLEGSEPGEPAVAAENTIARAVPTVTEATATVPKATATVTKATATVTEGAQKTDKPKKSTKGSFFSWSSKDKAVSPKKVLSPKREKIQKKKASTSPGVSPEKKPASPEKATAAAAARSRANFLNMRVRPLPPLPGHNVDPSTLPDHSEDDYEQFSLGTMDDSYVNYPKPLTLPTRSELGASSVRRWSSFGSNDVHTTSTSRSVRSVDVPDYIDGYVNTEGVPRQASGKALVGIDRRPLPKIPLDHSEQKDSQDSRAEKEKDEEEKNDYDYPDIHGALMFRNVSATMEWMERLKEKAKVDNMPSSISSLLYDGAQARLKKTTTTTAATETLLNRNEEDGLCRTYSNASSDYVPMAGNVEGDYVNNPHTSSWLPPRAAGPSPLARPLLQRERQQEEEEKQYAADDISVYMNLPTPEKRPAHSATLPRKFPAAAMLLTTNKNVSRPEVTSHATTEASNTIDGAKVPPEKLPKPKRKVDSPPRVLALENNKEETPQVLQGNHFDADYQNIESLPSERSISDPETEPKVPPAKLPKPNRSVDSPPKVSALENEVDDTPEEGWASPLQGNQLFDADYQNIDCSQSLPASSHAALLESPTLARRASDWDAALPPRNVRRPLN